MPKWAREHDPHTLSVVLSVCCEAGSSTCARTRTRAVVSVRPESLGENETVPTRKDQRCDCRHKTRTQDTQAQQKTCTHKHVIPFRPKPIRTISGVLEMISRFEFDFRRRGIFFERFEFFVFKVQSHTMWPYMCMCCGLYVPTQFHFECCGVRDDS